MKRILGLILVVLAFGSGCTTPPPRQQVELVYPPPPEQPRFYYERTLRTSADIEQEKSEGLSLKEILTGEKSSGQNLFGLAKPFAVAARGGRVYVSDTVLRVVYGFDLANEKFLRIGEEEPGKLRKPLGIDVSDDGRVFVSDGTNNRIVVYDRDGQYLDAFGGKQDFGRIGGLAVTPDGAKVFVVDTGGVESKDHRVRVYDVQTGNHLYDIGTRGQSDGQFNLPRDIAIGPDGRLYVSDGANFRVQVFEQDGTFVKTWGQVGRTFGSFSRPKGIATDRDGNVYVADASFGNFQIFNKDGALLLYIGDRGNTGGPGTYLLPAGIDVDEDGRVYFVDQFFRKVDVYRPAGLKKDEGLFAVKPKDDKADSKPKPNQ